jgi:VIT1/CCC1 family predicted Fe2+/Mn2+ transporter
MAFRVRRWITWSLPSPGIQNAGWIGWSAGLTLIALLVFGAVKGKFGGVDMLKSALQTALVGSLAASAAYFLARLVNKFG